MQNIADSIPGDPDYGPYRIALRPGMTFRLTRNLDKKRGFVNGAIGQVESLLYFCYWFKKEISVFFLIYLLVGMLS